MNWSVFVQKGFATKYITWKSAAHLKIPSAEKNLKSSVREQFKIIAILMDLFTLNSLLKEIILDLCRGKCATVQQACNAYKDWVILKILEDFNGPLSM